MSLRAFLPLLLVAVGTGYLAGLWVTLRTMDHAAPAGPGDGPAAREALAALRARAERPGEDDLAAARAAFLERWPDSWLRARWGAGR